MASRGLLCGASGYCGDKISICCSKTRFPALRRTARRRELLGRLGSLLLAMNLFRKLVSPFLVNQCLCLLLVRRTGFLRCFFQFSLRTISNFSQRVEYRPWTRFRHHGALGIRIRWPRACFFRKFHTSFRAACTIMASLPLTGAISSSDGVCSHFYNFRTPLTRAFWIAASKARLISQISDR